MAEKAKQEEVRCPTCHTSRIRLRGIRNSWEPTFEMGRGNPVSSDLRVRGLTYWCDDCQREFLVERK